MFFDGAKPPLRASAILVVDDSAASCAALSPSLPRAGADAPDNSVVGTGGGETPEMLLIWFPWAEREPASFTASTLRNDGRCCQIIVRLFDASRTLIKSRLDLVRSSLDSKIGTNVSLPRGGKVLR